MPLGDNIWYLGAQLMASVQARDEGSALEQLDAILRIIARESDGRFSHYKLRTLQVLTNVNRAAFNAGASTDLLAQHSLNIVGQIDRVRNAPSLKRLAQTSLRKTLRLVPPANVYKEAMVQEAIQYIRDNFTVNITRAQLAGQLKCSSAHFSRTFSLTTGYTFKDFLLQCRLEKAKELLRQSHLNIAEIAQAVGYEDPFQFSKIFRKRVGTSPRSFRKARQSRPLDSTPKLAP